MITLMSMSFLTAPASTVVEFESGSITVSQSEEVTYRLDTKVAGVVEAQAAVATAAPAFSVETAIGTDKSVVAAIDLSLFAITTNDEVETATPTSLSESASVTITTYIAKGLSNVSVTYTGEGAQPTDVSYDAATGLLIFKTTHFSTFAVAADQIVYDKTSNTAYKLSEDGLLLDNSNASVAADSTHEYVLLDNSKANKVSDSIDAFYAGYKWSAVHAVSESSEQNSLDGYGTKIEPYMISDYDEYSYLINRGKRVRSNGNYRYCIGVYDLKVEPEATYIEFDSDIDFEYKNPLFDDYYQTNQCYRINLRINGNNKVLSNVRGILFGTWDELETFTYWDFELRNVTFKNFFGGWDGYAIAYGGSMTDGGTITVDGVNVIFSDADDCTQSHGSLFCWTSANPIVIKNSSVVNAKVIGGSDMCIGGFVGNGQAVTIDNCSFQGTVVSESQNASGFIGQGGKSCIIKDSEIKEGSIIKNNKDGGTVTAFGTASLTNNEFYGNLVCNIESNASQVSGKWLPSTVLAADTFAISGNRITMNANNYEISSVIISVHYAIDRFVVSENNRFDGFMPFPVYSIKVSDLTGDYVAEIREIKNIINIVDTNYVDNVHNSSTDDSYLINDYRLLDTCFYQNGTTVYVDGRGVNPAFYSGSAIYSNQSLSAVNMTEGEAFITIVSYNGDGKPIGYNTLTYSFNLCQ